MNAAVSLNPVVPLAGRILLAALFLVSGVRGIIGFAGTAGYFAKLGFPAPKDVDAAQLNNQLAHFLKNLAVIGGLMMVAAFGPGPASADKA